MFSARLMVGGLCLMSMLAVLFSSQVLGGVGDTECCLSTPSALWEVMISYTCRFVEVCMFVAPLTK